ncbi:MmgE/PrpD family protein [Phytohabitans suffuscus]|uniref:2-methylcitrate dehydratase n=1 Tax=Phytohabitans suffuscus TaxID=624315 RepID=A0A6F8YPY1_9ACTN|nr:MmgE/PrpD family protein [Phytohabitans suffuscus]BCB88235.1 2-methylcitrate dehydratase [Phytohabitans suffuscus]
MSVSQALGEYAAALSYADIPGPVLDHARLLVLDTLMCGALGAVASPEVELLTRTLTRGEPGGGPATGWMTGAALSPPSAALVNATAVHAFELDDVAIGQHYGASVLPPALAVAPLAGPLDGRDLLTALVAGCEVAARVQRAAGRAPHAEVGFHGPSLIATFAAAVAAGRALRLDATGLAHAIGHAAQQASGIMATQHGGMGKRLLPGVAARNGTFAALLAAEGFTSGADMLERPYGGYFPVVSGGASTWDAARALDVPAGHWATVETRFKFWACRFPIHPALEGLRDLRARYGLDASSVDRVEVELDPAAYKAVGFPWQPTSTASAQQNLRICVASYILDGDVFLDQFTPAALARPELLDLAGRVEPVEAAGGELFKRESPVRVHLRDGRELTALGRVRGGADDPGTPALVAAKAGRLAAAIGRGDDFVEALGWRQLDELAGAESLLHTMRPTERGTR